MPGYVMHVTFAKLVEEKLCIKDSNRFLAGSLIPDACTCYFDKDKTIGHFATKINGLFKNPDLGLFFEKYGNLLNDEVVLGIYSHLYLDKYYYNGYMYEVYYFSDDTMLNLYTGKEFKIWKEFFVKEGIYKEYSAMNKMFIEDYNLDIESLNFELENLPRIDEFDYSRLKTFKKRIMRFMTEDGKYTGEYIVYEDVKKFIEDLAVQFVRHVNELKIQSEILG